MAVMRRSSPGMLKVNQILRLRYAESNEVENDISIVLV